MAIFNKYKDSLNNLIDSSDLKSVNQAKPIDEKFCNTYRLKCNLTSLLEKNYLDKNVLNRSLQLVLITENL